LSFFLASFFILDLPLVLRNYCQTTIGPAKTAIFNVLRIQNQK